MSRRRFAAALLLLLPVAAGAQVPQVNEPRAGYVYPAGGQRGTTFRVTVGGQFLEGVDRALVSGSGVAATIVDYSRPLTPAQLGELREKLRAAQQRRNDPTARDEASALRTQIAGNQRRIMNPAIAQTVTLEVTIAAGATAGARMLRLATPRGLTNPIAFEIGELPEFRETDAVMPAEPEEVTVALPAVVNGRIVPREPERPQPGLRPGQPALAADTDRIRFAARKGETVVVTAAARRLIPYLADAVPGWFQATLTLYDASGREVAYADDDRFDPDPVLRHHIPADGEYVVEIGDALFRGREDFVYRLTVGGAPAVEGASPACARSPERPPGARALSLPVVLTGCIGRPGERDTYTFKGRSGETIVAEVIARRMRSPLDSVLELLDPDGRRVAVNDDTADRTEGLLTHDADAVIAATLAKTGTYVLRVTDASRKGGLDFAYRLRLGPPQPDFELRATPSTINIAPGGTAFVTVVARRIDGFTGEIAFTLKGAPDGFLLSGGVLAAGEDSVQLTLAAPPALARAILTVALEGRAAINGATVTRAATAADDVMQAFAYRHLVPADALRIAVSPRRARKPPTGRPGL